MRVRGCTMVAMQALVQRVLAHVRRYELLTPGLRVGVAVSGGIDSVALLRLLLELRNELGIVLSVVHFNHELRGEESDADQEFVAALSQEHDLEFICDSDDVHGHAAEENISLEAAARELRYGYFRHLLGENLVVTPQEMSGTGLEDRHTRGLKRPLHKIVTGHTLDDQAETVLMRMIRGAGFTGLGGIHPRIPVEGDDAELSGEIVRPLLSIRRGELKQYLFQIQQSWREDSSNASLHFTRNRLRQLVVPLLEQEFNPAIAENLSELAEIARGEEDYWENETAGWMGTAVHWEKPDWARSRNDGLVQIGAGGEQTGSAGLDGSWPGDDLSARINDARWLVMNASVDRIWFVGEPIAVQRRLVKAIGKHAGIPLEFKHVDEIVRFSGELGSAEKELFLPLGWKLVRKPDELLFVTPDLHGREGFSDFEYPLSIPGQIYVREIGVRFEVRAVPAGEQSRYNPDYLLDADSLPGRLSVRNGRAGDRFWPSHTKSPKKIKELLQDRHVPPAERWRWPVVVHGSEILWMRGFAVPLQFRAGPGRDAVLILETPAATEIGLS